MGNTLTVLSPKGGTGKTTTAAALAQAAAAHGRKVLAIDLDPQANLSFALGSSNAVGITSFDLITGKPMTAGKIEGPSVSLIPASVELASLESGQGSALRLSKALRTAGKAFDLIVIDTPPTFGELQYNALQAATDLIIPLQADAYCVQALDQLAEVLQAFPRVTVRGIVITKMNTRSNVKKQMQELLISKADALGIPFLTGIRESVAVQEAYTLQEDLYQYAPRSNPAQDYNELYKALFE